VSSDFPLLLLLLLLLRPHPRVGVSLQRGPPLQLRQRAADDRRRTGMGFNNSVVNIVRYLGGGSLGGYNQFKGGFKGWRWSAFFPAKGWCMVGVLLFSASEKQIVDILGNFWALSELRRLQDAQK
jgi:hypothetical protein